MVGLPGLQERFKYSFDSKVFSFSLFIFKRVSLPLPTGYSFISHIDWTSPVSATASLNDPQLRMRSKSTKTPLLVHPIHIITVSGCIICFQHPALSFRDTQGKARENLKSQCSKKKCFYFLHHIVQQRIKLTR